MKTSSFFFLNKEVLFNKKKLRVLQFSQFFFIPFPVLQPYEYNHSLKFYNCF